MYNVYKSRGVCVRAGVYLDSTTDFTVDATSVQPKAEGLVRALITSPSGTLTEAIVKNQQNGQYHCLYTPVEQGQLVSRLVACVVLFVESRFLAPPPSAA